MIATSYKAEMEITMLYPMQLASFYYGCNNEPLLTISRSASEAECGGRRFCVADPKRPITGSSRDSMPEPLYRGFGCTSAAAKKVQQRLSVCSVTGLAITLTDPEIGRNPLGLDDFV